MGILSDLSTFDGTLHVVFGTVVELAVRRHVDQRMCVRCTPCVGSLSQKTLASWTAFILNCSSSVAELFLRLAVCFPYLVCIGICINTNAQRCWTSTRRGSAQPPAQEKAPSQVVSQAKAAVVSQSRRAALPR